MRTLILLAAVAVAGCTVNPTREEAFRAQMKPMIGQPLTAYLQATGTTPTSSYDTADGRRHFVFDNSSFVSTPTVVAGPITVPGYAGTRRCNVTVETQPTGSGGTPDAFRIVSATMIGC